MYDLLPIYEYKAQIYNIFVKYISATRLFTYAMWLLLEIATQIACVSEINLPHCNKHASFLPKREN